MLPTQSWFKPLIIHNLPFCLAPLLRIKLNFFRGLCQKMTKIFALSKIETDINQNLTDDFCFLFVRSEDFSIETIFSGKIWVYQINFWKKKINVLYAKLNKRTEVAINIYSTASCFLLSIYSMFIAENNQKSLSRFLVYEFSFTFSL